MKKNLFILAAAAVALASCSSDDLISENAAAKGGQPVEIAFNPVSKVVTRAATDANVTNAVSGTEFPRNYTMSVVAYNYTDASHKGDYFGSATGNIFTFQPRTSNGWWAGTDPQYWPLSPTTLNFLAVTEVGPAGVDVVTPTFGDNGSTWAKQVSIALADNKPNDSGNQHDLMYANGQGKVTQSGNGLSFDANDAVEMEFHHALAWVYFRVKGASATETTGNYAITINSITLNNAYYQGTFLAKLNTVETTSSLEWATDAANLKWTSPASQSDNASPNYTYLGASSSKVLTQSYQNVGDGLLVVPTGSMETPVVSFDNFTINYTMAGNTYDYTYTPTDEQKKLLLGKKYVFDITFKLHEIFVDASVADWETTPTNYVEVPSQSMAYDNLQAVTFDNAAGIYTFDVTGFTAGQTVAVAETTDANNIITSVKANTTVPTGGVVTVAVEKPGTENDKTATITLTVNGTQYPITINTPATPVP